MVILLLASGAVTMANVVVTYMLLQRRDETRTALLPLTLAGTTLTLLYDALLLCYLALQAHVR